MIPLSGLDVVRKEFPDIFTEQEIQIAKEIAHLKAIDCNKEQLLVVVKYCDCIMHMLTDDLDIYRKTFTHIKETFEDYKAQEK